VVKRDRRGTRRECLVFGKWTRVLRSRSSERGGSWIGSLQKSGGVPGSDRCDTRGPEFLRSRHLFMAWGDGTEDLNGTYSERGRPVPGKHISSFPGKVSMGKSCGMNVDIRVGSGGICLRKWAAE